ncbi:MAG: hypothetical protein QGI45_08935 [Myxococcota bacterium]|jgi:hypothetical protein|nr:hypothetical protein [Myxococcota bacterium]
MVSLINRIRQRKAAKVGSPVAVRPKARNPFVTQSENASLRTLNKVSGQPTTLNSLTDGSKIQVIFENFWREDFVGEALTIEFTHEQNILHMEFYSAKLGIVKWDRGEGVKDANLWECTEERRRHASSLLTMPVFDPNQRRNESRREIIEMVLNKLEDLSLASRIKEALRAPTSNWALPAHFYAQSF